ncbi:kinesin-like protein KIN-14L [Carica papaya]|uniref:kinesin-like protein KIN-14L n=1 Tax=Carica papaya TaxID=3649 RepID=UPI000B8CCAA4|nr:kinesin-like protein KIN-14L [Carica papaya]
MSAVCDKQPVEDAIVKVLLDHMIDTKENINDNLLVSLRKRNPDSVKLIKKIISNFMNENLLSDFPDLKSKIEDFPDERSISSAYSTPTPLEEITIRGNSQCQKASLMKGACNHKRLLQVQERELLDLKELLSTTKREFQDLQCQLQRFWGEIGNQVQEMSTAALGYHKVLKENRKLYNMVQDLKGSIRVYCRVRPTFTAERKNVVDFIGEDGSIVIFDPSKPQKDGRKVFQFNRVFGPTSTQEEVFLDIQPLIRSVMDGYNVCIFAYGQTGSGKTYTMSGPSDGSTNHTGINYQALEDLFLISKEREDIIKYIIHVQMVEIYNEQVRDLLAEDSSTTRLEIRSCTSESGMNLPDATMHSVNSTVDVLNLMKLGEVNRVVSSTAINSRSSRSHSILTVHVHGKDASGGIQRSCLHLVDLAGSERVDKSKVTGDRLKEAQYINKSLSCLGDVITALSQKNSHIPYRNSKLTLLLQEALGGHAKTLMFAHLSPEEDSFGETISTLKFAQRVSTVELGAARVNKESNEVIQLKEQVESLKKALANKEQNVLYSKTKEIRSPRDKTISMNERTPPHVRRLSIENGSAAKSLKVINPEDRRALRTPIVTRTRRLSLEGQRSAATKDNIHTKKSEDESKSTSPGIGSIKKPFGHFSNGSFTMDVYHLQVPRSPTSSCRKRTVKKDGRTQIPHLQLPKSPEPKVVARNQVQIVMQSEFSVPDESRTTNGYGIRKSLRNIGKLINGSEKR